MSKKKTSGRAGESELGTLHGLFAKFLAHMLESGSATAAELSVMRQFLKDNGITADPETNDDIQSIVHGIPTSDELDEMSIIGGEQ